MRCALVQLALSSPPHTCLQADLWPLHYAARPSGRSEARCWEELFGGRSALLKRQDQSSALRLDMTAEGTDCERRS